MFERCWVSELLLGEKPKLVPEPQTMGAQDRQVAQAREPHKNSDYPFGAAFHVSKGSSLALGRIRFGRMVTGH